MKLKDLDRHIVELKARLVNLEQAREHLQFLESQLIIKKKDLEQLSDSVYKEGEDVERMESLQKQLLSQWFNQGLEDQFEKEKEEYLEAILNHRAGEKELQLLIYEHEIVSEKVEAQEQVQQEYENALRLRERQILQTPTSIHVLELNAEIELNIDYQSQGKGAIKRNIAAQVSLDTLITELNQLQKIFIFPDDKERLERSYSEGLDKARVSLLRSKLYIRLLQRVIKDWLALNTISGFSKEEVAPLGAVLSQKFATLERFFHNMREVYLPKSENLANASAAASAVQLLLERIDSEFNYALEALRTKGKGLQIEKERLLTS